MGKKLISVLLLCSVLSLCFSVNTGIASAEEDYNVIWTYEDDTKTIIFYGNGAVGDNRSLFEEGSYQPMWYQYKNATEHIVFKDGITGIGIGAFYCFTNLKTVTMSDSVRMIGAWAFRYCLDLEKIVLSKNITDIGEAAFDNCELLKSIKLPKKLKSVGSFSNCSNLKSIELPDSIKRTDPELLSTCLELKSVKLPKHMKTIKRFDFSDTEKLRKLKIPESVKSVCMSAFIGSGLKVIDLPKNVVTIKNGNLGYNVFSGREQPYRNKRLRKIILRSEKIKTIQKRSFSGLSKNVTILVPKSCLKKYSEMLYKSGMSRKNKVRAIK